MWPFFEAVGEAVGDATAALPFLDGMPRAGSRIFLVALFYVGATVYQRFSMHVPAMLAALNLPQGEIARSFLLLVIPCIALYLLRMRHASTYQATPGRGPGGHLWLAGVTFVFWFMACVGTAGFNMPVYPGSYNRTMYFVGLAWFHAQCNVWLVAGSQRRKLNLSTFLPLQSAREFVTGTLLTVLARLALYGLPGFMMLAVLFQHFYVGVVGVQIQRLVEQFICAEFASVVSPWMSAGYIAFVLHGLLSEGSPTWGYSIRLFPEVLAALHLYKLSGSVIACAVMHTLWYEVPVWASVTPMSYIAQHRRFDAVWCIRMTTSLGFFVLPSLYQPGGSDAPKGAACAYTSALVTAAFVASPLIYYALWLVFIKPTTNRVVCLFRLLVDDVFAHHTAAAESLLADPKRFNAIEKATGLTSLYALLPLLQLDDSALAGRHLVPGTNARGRDR